MKIEEVIVVEGKSDTNKLKLAVDADTIETNGSAISKETLQRIAHAAEKRGVIVFTDPDYAGKRIRHIISERIPDCKHAFLPKGKTQPKDENKSVGIEHAKVEDIQKALAQVTQAQNNLIMSNIKREDLVERGLIGGKSAKQKREFIGDKLFIGYANGKQLLKRLQMYRIQLDELDQVLLELEGI